MKRHYRSRQHRLTLRQSVIATSKQARESPVGTIGAGLAGQGGSFNVCTIWSGPEKDGRKHSVYLWDLSHVCLHHRPPLHDIHYSRFKLMLKMLS